MVFPADRSWRRDFAVGAAGTAIAVFPVAVHWIHRFPGDAIVSVTVGLLTCLWTWRRLDGRWSGWLFAGCAIGAFFAAFLALAFMDLGGFASALAQAYGKSEAETQSMIGLWSKVAALILAVRAMLFAAIGTGAGMLIRIATHRRPRRPVA